MKIIFYISILLFLTCCGSAQKNNIPGNSDGTENNTTTDAENEKPQIQYTDQQLERYLDSIGGLPPSKLADNVSFFADSTFKNQLQMDRNLSESDFEKLKKIINEKEEIERIIDLKTAKRIFGEIAVDSSYLVSGRIPVTLISFDKNQNDLNEFAICLGNPNSGWNCKLYFFKRNRIIAKHLIEHHYGLEIKHYKDTDNKTIIYYEENFGTGTGIWQFNYFFYKYDGNKLIPILNELQNGNLQTGWGPRIYWLETSIVKTNPLTLKMVYYQELYDKKGNAHRIIDDSTFVQYAWDENAKVLAGDYRNSKINKQQILTYFVADNEILFINTYYKTLKSSLKVKKKRQLTLLYLNKIKNYYD